MKKYIRWSSAFIFIETSAILLFTWNSTITSGIANPFVFYFLIPIQLLGISFFALFLLSFQRKDPPASVFAGFFESNRISFIIILIIIAFLLICSLIFFIVADLLDPGLHSSLLPYAILGFVLFWEILILFSFTREELKGKSKYWIGIPLLLAANYFLRHTLERAGIYLEPFLEKVYKNHVESVFTTYKWWQLMLPIKEFHRTWSFGLMITHYMESVIGTAGVWYLNQAVLMLVAFFISWKVFRSKLFSYFLAICLGFGTHFYNAFQYSGIACLYLLQTLFLLLFYFSYEYIRKDKKSIGYLIALIPTLLLTAIFYEGWLDFFASVWGMSIFLYIYLRIKKQTRHIKKLLTIFVIFNIIAAIYIYMKFTYVGFAHSSGESAIVFSYKSEYVLLGIEDVISNYITHLYMTLTNFLPPELITSNALYQYSEVLESKRQLIFGHYIFFWRYAAGILATLFFIGLYQVIRKVFQEKPFSELFPLAMFMIMVAVNGATHTIIQIRIFKTMPVIGYHVQQGVLGLSLCIAYLFHLFEQKTENKKVVVLISSIAIFVILYSSIRRPNYLWHMMEIVGIDHQGPFPNPFFELIKIIREVIPGFLAR